MSMDTSTKTDSYRRPCQTKITRLARSYYCGIATCGNALCKQVSET